MALTDAQIVDVRRWAGYGMAGDGSVRLPYTVTLDERLGALTSSEEAVLTDTYLAILTTLEAAIPAAAANLDTLEAGPWKANPHEMSQRSNLFNKWRREMCSFLGVVPGPGLGSGSVTLMRG